MKQLNILIVVMVTVSACQPTKQERINMLMDSVNSIQQSIYSPATSNTIAENHIPANIPRQHTAPLNREVLHPKMMEKDSIKNVRLMQCMGLIDEILTLDSMHFWANGAKSMVLYEVGEYEQALKTNEELEKRFGDTIPDIYYSRSVILEKMGRYEGATFYYYQADRVLLENIKNNPNDTNLMMEYIAIGYEFDGEEEMKRRVARMKRDYPKYTSYFCKMLSERC